jgi:hypothetical protein
MRQIHKIKANQSQIVSEAKGHSPTFFHSHASSVEIEFADDVKLNPRREAFAQAEAANPLHRTESIFNSSPTAARTFSRARLGVEKEEVVKKPWYKCC